MPRRAKRSKLIRHGKDAFFKSHTNSIIPTDVGRGHLPIYCGPRFIYFWETRRLYYRSLADLQIQWLERPEGAAGWRPVTGPHPTIDWDSIDWANGIARWVKSA